MKRRFRRLIGPSVVILLACAAGSAAMGAQYRVVPAPPLNVAFGINAARELAGIVVKDGRGYPAVSRAGSVVTIPGHRPDFDGRALAINDRGEVAGDAMTPAPPPYEGASIAHAFFWSESTGTIDLTPGTAGASFAYAINNAGVVAGYRMEGDASGPFIWRVGTDGSVDEQRIGEPESTSNSAWDINDRGIVVGTHFEYAWVYDSTSRTLHILPDTWRGAAYGLNDRDEVVGHFRDDSFLMRAALWRQQGGEWLRTDLGALPHPHASCTAIDINNAGTIIGECIGPRGVPNRPFIVEPREPMRGIDELLTPEDAARWEIVGLYDINASGTMVAAGRLDGGPARLVLVEPVPRQIPRRRAAAR